MPKAKYQFETDFLTTVPAECADFVLQVHSSLVKQSYKPRITVTKSTGLQIAYHQSKIKSTVGILIIFFKRQDKLILRVYGFGYKKYLKLLESLSQSLIKQIGEATDCKKFLDPDKCFKGCGGHNFQIGERSFQKCYVDCFEFEVLTDDMPYLTKLVEEESKARFLCEVQG